MSANGSLLDSSRRRSPLHQAIGLAGWLVLTSVAAAIGGAASIDAGPFYSQLERPGWAPPSQMFGPVWTLLYLSMAVAAWLIWRAAAPKQTRLALVLFVAQLALNALWSWLFFGWRLGGAAFVDIIMLWILIVATVVAFSRIRPLAAGLLLPYLFWVTFAAALNYSVWQMNPATLG